MKKLLVVWVLSLSALVSRASLVGVIAALSIVTECLGDGTVALEDGLSVGFSLRLGKDAAGRGGTVTCEAMKALSVSREADVVTAVWTGHPLCGPSFSVTARLRRTKDGYVYAFDYRGNEAGADVEEIVFPEVAARRTDRTSLLVPHQSGVLYHSDWKSKAPGERMTKTGPRYMGCRFVAALNEGALPSVYLDQRDDARFYTARFELDKGVAADTVVLKSVHEMPISDTTRRAYTLPYGGVIRTFAGGWFEAAKIYRDWAKGESWYAQAASRDFGKLKDVSLWMWNRGPRDVTVPPALKFMEDTGLKVALDWYWWHEIPYDTCYPFFWPPRESVASFRAGVDAVRRAGGYVQPYTNGMLWDMDDARWTEGGDEGVIVGRNGKPVFETYNPYTKQRQAFMCGEAPKFHETMRTLVRTLRETGMDGVYMDMIATAGHGACHNARHCHPRGGGRHMTDGYRRYLDAVRADNPGLFLSSEEQGEAYLDKFESLISVYPSHERFGVGVRPQAEKVPVFEAVYHGAIVLFGSYATIGNIPPWDPKWGTSPAAANTRDPYAGEDLEDEKARPDQFACEFARGVVWGLQPTVHKFLLAHATEPRFAADYAFVRETARFYHDNRDLLFDGEMCAPGKMTCEGVSVEFLQRGSYTRPGQSKTLVEHGVPAVMHSVWRTKDGSRTAAVLVNWTRHPQAYALQAGDVAEQGVLPPRSWRRVPSAQARQAGFTLEKAGVRVTVDGRGRLTHLVNRETGHDWAGGGALWRLYLDRRFTPAGTPVAAVREEREICVEAADQTPEVTAAEDGSVLIRYPHLTVRGERADIALTFRVGMEADGTVRFSSKVENNLPHSIVRELHFPLVGDCALPAGAELLTTHLGGMRIKNPLARIGKPGWSPPYMGPDQKFRQFDMWDTVTLKYPAHTTGNCFAFLTETEGLYVASHDPSFQDTIHVLRCWPDANGSFTRLETGLAKYPNAMCGTTWENGCNVIRPYSGNWTQTSKLYRRWANTWWRKRTPPAWVKKMTGWQRIIFRHQYGEDLYTPADLTRRISKAGADAGLDTVLCFGWWRRGMDNGYPDSYFETEPAWGGDAGWKRAIAGYRAQGNNFLLYFNGKLIDTESDYFTKGPGRRIAYRTSAGQVYTEQYRFAGTGTFTMLYNARTFASADHRAPEWMDFLEKAVDRAVDFGASGVFFDQLGYCEAEANWDLSGEFAVPNVRTIAAKAAALSHLRDYVEMKKVPGFAIGTECFVDCCAQNVDFMHNLTGAAGGENFTDWARYTFPECVITDREIRDDFNVPWRVNHNLLVGLRSDVEIYRCRGLIDETPVYQKKLAEINRLRAAHPILLTGAFTGPDGLSVSTKDGLLAAGYREGGRLAVVCCTPRDRAASGTVAVDGMKPASGDAAVALSTNGITVVEFVRK